MPSRLIRRRGVTLVAGAVVAAMLALAAVAIAKSFTVNVAKNATVTNMSTMVTKHENIGVNGKGVRGLLAERGLEVPPEVHAVQRLLQVLAAGDVGRRRP